MSPLTGLKDPPSRFRNLLAKRGFEVSKKQYLKVKNTGTKACTFCKGGDLGSRIGTQKVWERVERDRLRSNRRMSALRPLRRRLVKEAQGKIRRRVGRGSPVRAEMRKEVDEVVLALRVARRAAAGVKEMSQKPSWLRLVRQATGIPVEQLAQQLEVTKNEVFRLEKAEREGRIVLGTLKRAAEALGCELVYGLAPKEGSLEDLAAGARAEREKRFAEARELEERIIKEIERKIGWDRSVMQMIRTIFRKEGLRVR